MPRALWLLVIGMAVNMTGSSFLWPLNTIYVHDHLGKSLSLAGIVVMLYAAGTVIGSLFGGSLYDKIGGYKSILLGIVLTCLALIGLIFWNNLAAYTVFLIFIGFGSGVIFPPMYAVAGSVWIEGGRKAFNALYVASNIGVAVGSALCGVVADYSFEYIFLANLLLYLLFFLIALFGYKGITSNGSVKPAGTENAPSIQGKNKNLRALTILCAGYALCWVAYVQWSTTISAYTQTIHIPLTQYSLLWTINGGLIVAGQPLMKLGVKHFAKSLKTQMLIGIIVFISSFIVVAQAHAFLGFAAGMVILTIGEMFVWPAVPTVAFKLSPKGKEGFYQGIVNSTATGGRMIGPLLGGVLVDVSGMRMLFIVLIGLYVIAIFTTIFYDHGLDDQENPVTKVSQNPYFDV